MKTYIENYMLLLKKYYTINKLKINTEKTKIMLIATDKKRTKNDLEFELNIEGKVIKEVESARLLGVEIMNNFSWEKQVEETIRECSSRLSGLYKISKNVNQEQRKKLAEGAILSRLRYGLEVVSSGTESIVKKLDNMQSKSARFVLGRNRREWSKSQGYEELRWLSIQQTAILSSLKMFFKVLKKREPKQLFNGIFDSDQQKLRSLSLNELEGMTKLSRKSWKTRVLRYGEYLPEYLFHLDPDKEQLNSSLKVWIKHNIEQDGDYIFKGKLRPPEKDDWLLRGLWCLKQHLNHELERLKQRESIEEESFHPLGTNVHPA